MRDAASRLRVLLALGVVLLPLLLAGATLAHTHDGPGIGLYNHEHDLVLMGALGSVAPLPTPAAAVAIVFTDLLVAAPPAVVDSSTRRLEVSRAPPTA
jgi:hypothetical protein